MFRVFVCAVAFVFAALCVVDAEAQVRVRARRGANVVVNQSFGGGAAQSAAIGGGFRSQGFRGRGFHGGGIAASQAVGFGHGGFAQRQVFVPQQRVFVQSFPVQTFAAPCVQPFGVHSFAAPCAQSFGGFGGFGGGISASAAVGY